MEKRSASNKTLFQRSLPIRTADGSRLTATIYEPEDRASATLLISAGIAIPQRFYAGFARAAAASGLRVVTYDYRGFAQSSAHGGPTATLTRWAEQDYPAVLRWILRHHGGQPVLALGHSFGGQILGLPEEASALHSAAIVASMNGYVRRLPRRRRRVEWAFRYVVPSVTHLHGHVPAWLGLGEPLPGAVARQWARWCLHRDYYLGEHPHYRQQLTQFTRPLTVLSFADDSIAPLVNVRWLVDLYARANPLHLHVEPRDVGLPRLGHVGFFRRAAAPLWTPLLNQLQAPRPDFRLGSVGRHSGRAPIGMDEVMADLQYGT